MTLSEVKVSSDRILDKFLDSCSAFLLIYCVYLWNFSFAEYNYLFFCSNSLFDNKESFKPKSSLSIVLLFSYSTFSRLYTFRISP